MNLKNGNPVQPTVPDWLFYDEGEDPKPVCTFIPEVICLIKIIGSEGQRETVRVKLHFKDGESTEAEIPTSQLNQVDWFKIDRRCIVNSQHCRVRDYIADSIRAGIYNAPTETMHSFDRLGIHHLSNTVAFAAGDRVITPSSATESDLNFELGQLPFHLNIDPEISPEEAFKGKEELIGLSPEIGRVLVAHVISGITRDAFKEAGITPCAVLVIVGESGMLKSNYVPHMVQLYNRADGIGAVTRFNSTKRYIEDVLYEYSECTAVIDDLHTAESTGIKKRNEDAAEEIIRRIGDDTGRGRMEGRSHVQKQFRGNVVFIGEYTIGKASTIPRALVAHLTKRPNGVILDKYQRGKKLLVSTFYFYFIQWYVNHFEDIRNEIDARLSNFRRKYAASDSDIHGRLRDTQFYLCASYMILLQFCQDSGFLSKGDALDEYGRFDVYLAQLIRTQQSKYKSDKEKEVIDYLSLIQNLYQKGSFRLSKKKEDFDPDKHDGLIYYNCLCLRRKRLDKKIRNVHPNANIDECIRYLNIKNALKVVEDKNSVQITGTNGIRFYAIKLQKFK